VRCVYGCVGKKRLGAPDSRELHRDE